jgi:hypothetical protein
MFLFIQRNGGSEQLVQIKSVEVGTGVTQPLDTLVARQKIVPGQVCLDEQHSLEGTQSGISPAEHAEHVRPYPCNRVLYVGVSLQESNSAKE